MNNFKPLLVIDCSLCFCLKILKAFSLHNYAAQNKYVNTWSSQSVCWLNGLCAEFTGIAYIHNTCYACIRSNELYFNRSCLPKRRVCFHSKHINFKLLKGNKSVSPKRKSNELNTNTNTQWTEHTNTLSLIYGWRIAKEQLVDIISLVENSLKKMRFHP